MATVSNISLSIAKGSSANTSNVTVSGTMNFDASEVGKSYRLEVKIFGEDKAGDNLPSTDLIGDDQLYTFLWGGLFLKLPFKQFVVSTAGDQSFTETRVLTSDKLDEDSGQAIIGWADIHTPILSPRKDEIYARVMLSGAPVSARSATISLGIGV
jgi:hypothetical protein